MTPQQELEAAWTAATTPQERAAALQDVVSALPPLEAGEARVPLTLPHGTYDIADHDGDGIAINVTRPCLLSLNGSLLRCEAGTTAIRVGNGASYARVCDGAIAYPGGVQVPGSTALRLCAHGVRASDIRITYGDIGVLVDGRDEFDANACQVREIAIWGSRLPWWVVGGDSNAGLFEGIEINGDGLATEAGILDESFLGNTLVGFHVATTEQHAYKATQSACYSTVVGLYAEANCGYQLPGGYEQCIQSQARVTFLGGGAVGLVSVGDRVGLGLSRLACRARLPGGGTVQVTIPDPGRNAAMTVERLTNAGLVEEGVSLRWVDSGSLERLGFHVFTGAGYNGTSPVPDNGITMPAGWTSSRHARGLGRGVHDANQGDPWGETHAKRERA